MPKTKLTKKYCEPKPNYLAETLRCYKRSSGLTSQMIADRTGQTRQTVQSKLLQKPGNWKLSDLTLICLIIGCPLSEAFDAYQKSL